jgi:hypothetical protein
MNRAGPVLVVAAAALVAGCSVATTGVATPTARTSTGSPPPTSSAGDPLTKVDPCGLLSATTMAKNGITKKKTFNTAESRGCTFTRPADEQESGYVFGIDLYDHVGYQDFDSTGYTITPHNVGSHPGIEVTRGVEPDSCIINFEITATSHIQITVIVENQDTQHACTLAQDGAGIVNSNLPAGLRG